MTAVTWMAARRMLYEGSAIMKYGRYKLESGIGRSAMQLSSFVPVLSGLFGAIIGALANAYLRDRSERRTSREALVGEIAGHASEMLAALLELFQAGQVEGSGLEKWSKLAAAERVLGKGMALEIRIFREFRARRVRAAYRRLLNRAEALKDAIRTDDLLVGGTVQDGVEAARGANLSFCTRGVRCRRD